MDQTDGVLSPGIDRLGNLVTSSPIPQIMSSCNSSYQISSCFPKAKPVQYGFRHGSCAGNVDEAGDDGSSAGIDQNYSFEVGLSVSGAGAEHVSVTGKASASLNLRRRVPRSATSEINR